MYSLRNFYALNYYLTFVYFLEVEGAGVTGLDIQYWLYINVYSLRKIYTPKYYLSFVMVFVFLFRFFFDRGSDLKYLLHRNVYYVQFFAFCHCFCFWWGLGGQMIGYKVIVVYKFIFIEKCLCTQLIFFSLLLFCCGVGG